MALRNPALARAFGKRLRQLRSERGLTQCALASLLHMSNKVLSRYEAGMVDVPLSRAYAIALVLHVSLSSLCPLQDTTPMEGERSA